MWVPMHTGIKDNEKADKLAKEESKQRAAHKVKPKYIYLKWFRFSRILETFFNYQKCN